MSDAVVDTDVVSFLFRRDKRIEAYRRHLIGRRLVVSFMTVAELEAWALIRKWGEINKARMRDHLRNFVLYPIERAVCVKWAEATAAARASGQQISCADAWIAATALEHGIPLNHS
jgi:predicted nucleic acid-binding protein